MNGPSDSGRAESVDYALRAGSYGGAYVAPSLLVADVPRLQGATVYSRIGDAFARTAGVFALGALALALGPRTAALIRLATQVGDRARLRPRRVPRTRSRGNSAGIRSGLAAPTSPLLPRK